MDEVELRFVVEAEEAAGFVRRARDWLRPEVFGAAGGLSYTRTTYLDTDWLAYFQESFGAISRRWRVREYAFSRRPRGRPRFTGICALEYKQSAGARREKLRHLASSDAIARMLEAGEAAPGCPGELLELLGRERLVPVAATWYRRRSYVSADEALRVTVDDQLAFCRPGPPGAAGEYVPAPEVLEVFSRCVLEVKCRAMPPAWLTALVAPLPPALGFSKFRAAILATLAVSARRADDVERVAGGVHA